MRTRTLSERPKTITLTLPLQVTVEISDGCYSNCWIQDADGKDLEGGSDTGFWVELEDKDCPDEEEE